MSSSIDDKILEATRAWYELISKDHHKDRDCHFGVYKVWSYGMAPVYTIWHSGYLTRIDSSIKWSSYEEAEEALLEFINEAIAEWSDEDNSDK